MVNIRLNQIKDKINNDIIVLSGLVLVIVIGDFY